MAAENEIYIYSPILTLHDLGKERGALTADNAVGGDGSRRAIILGNGSCADFISFSADGGFILESRIDVFWERGCNVHGITVCPKSEYFIVFGEKSVALLSEKIPKVAKSCVHSFVHWIQSLTVFSDDTLAILFACNEVSLFRYSTNSGKSFDLQIMESVQSSHKATVLYSLLDGKSWKDLLAIVGTVFGEILIWCPSKGPSLEFRLNLHTGMIFGLLLKNDCLFTISDDRSLSMWCLREKRQLDSAYGHAARPFTVVDGPHNSVITSGQDSVICIWGTEKKKFSLIYRLQFGGGLVRSLLFVPEVGMLVGTGNGHIACIDFPSKSFSSSIECFEHSSPIRSFATVPGGCTAILNANGEIWLKKDKRMELITKCVSARHDSLLLSPCTKFFAVSSAKELFVVDVGGSCCQYIRVETPCRITAILWVKNNDLLVCCESGKVELFALLEASTLVPYASFTLPPKDVPSAAIHINDGSDKLIIGSRKGNIFVVSGNEVISVSRRCHGKDSVTAFAEYRGALLSAGRDGMICKWKLSENNEGLHRICSQRPPSFAVAMEWPCRFIFIGEQLFIAGFHGANLLVIDYENGHSVCELNCGGGHRIWQLSITSGDQEGKNGKTCTALVEFTKKGSIIRVATHLYTLRTISPSAHISAITAVSAFHDKNKALVLATAGIDTYIALSRINKSGYPTVLSRIRAHTSSIYALSSSEDYLISVGGKSELFIWRWMSESLQNVFYRRLHGDCRLVSVHLITVRPLTFVVSGSDGRLLVFVLKEDMKIAECCVPLEDCTEDFTVHSKVIGIRWKGSIAVFAVSTSGLLKVWRDATGRSQRCEVTHIEAAGLSAVDILHQPLLDSGDSLIVAVGSESGRVSALRFPYGEKPTICSNYWHGATCTALVIRKAQFPKQASILSLALDSRLALFAYSIYSNQLDFCRAITLCVADPSALCVVDNKESSEAQIIVAGSSIQILPLWQI